MKISLSRFLAGWACALFLLMPLFAAANDSGAAFVPGEVWKDTQGIPINAHGGSILFDHGTYYWFGEFKTAGEAGNLAHVGISCYSSSDLYHWKNMGIALHVSADPASDIAEGSIMERPRVLYNPHSRKYVMWFHLELRGQGYRAARVGVAVSDTPTGPFHYLRSFRPDGEMSRDLTLFQDDDGKAYLVTASEENMTIHVSLLNESYLGTTGTFHRIFVNQQLEAPAIFKYAGKYYFVGSHCTGWAPNPAVSAVADSILGPWKMLGNPARGAGADLTFGAQDTYVLPVAGSRYAFIFMADRWHPQNAIDGRYVWLPIRLGTDGFTVPWLTKWSLEVFSSAFRDVSGGTRHRDCPAPTYSLGGFSGSAPGVAGSGANNTVRQTARHGYESLADYGASTAFQIAGTAWPLIRNRFKAN